jgi:hypothetical protein
MWNLVLKAYVNLIYFDLCLRRGDFGALYAKVARYPIAKPIATSNTVDSICTAMDMACIWYWKEALCLQRSAATTCLLRRYGVSAELVLGAQRLPFKAHAWVEVDGHAVNDKPYVSEAYTVLDRC